MRQKVERSIKFSAEIAELISENLLLRCSQDLPLLAYSGGHIIGGCIQFHITVLPWGPWALMTE